MSHVHRASWVLPVDAPPIRDGCVEVDNGRIVAVGAAEPRGASCEPRVAILPALVNAHTHLELSWMRGRVPPGDAMPAWAARLISERQQGDSIQRRSTAGADFRKDAIVAAIAEARASGTGLVGDVTNTLEACGPLADSRLSATVFFELLGFRSADPAALVEAAQGRLADLPASNRMRWAVAPHAPYSVLSESVSRDCRGRSRATPECSPRRVPRRDPVLTRRSWPVAGSARANWRLESGMGRARMWLRRIHAAPRAPHRWPDRSSRGAVQ